MQEVAIEAEEPQLLKHDPEVIPSLHGMEVVDASDAPDDAEYCGRCYPSVRQNVVPALAPARSIQT